LNQNSNIRRIDELGRIVIPKDIRKKLHIKDNEPLEIFIEDNEIRIKKYSALPDIIEHIKYLADMGNRITNNKYIITDRTHIIAATNKEYEGEVLAATLESFVLTGAEIKNDFMNLSLSSTYQISANINIAPILVDNDRSGVIIEYNEEKTLPNDNIVKIFKNLIEKKLNNY